MKYFIRMIAVIGLISAVALTAACAGSSKKAEPTYVTGTDSESALSAQTEPAAATEPTADNAAETTDSDTAYQAQLTAARWNLTAVYKDGEQQSIGVQYGSVIRETGAYMEFHEDNSFKCILGYQGCEGTYTVVNGALTLHITTKYNGRSENGNPCDENAAVNWDHEANTLSFDFNGVTNVFAQ